MPNLVSFPKAKSIEGNSSKVVEDEINVKLQGRSLLV
jgi:hypothetical protein